MTLSKNQWLIALSIIFLSSQSFAMSIVGSLTYEDVPSTSSGLDYGASVYKPIRGATVQALNSNGDIIGSTQSYDNGIYVINSLPSNTDIRIRVLAEVVQNGTASWNIQVKDNVTRSFFVTPALYTLDGNLTSSGSLSTQIRDLVAHSGWTGSGYGNTRDAAPFAILDTFYEGVLQLENIKSDINVPDLTVYWSEDNVKGNGLRQWGFIGTSHYSSSSSSIYILGDEDQDTDEYDDFVLLHEFGHHLSATLARDDHPGGSHQYTSREDFRLVFSEAWAHVFAGFVIGSSVFLDSIGNNQAGVYSFNMEDNRTVGWFEEGTVTSLIWDYFDSNNDSDDSLSLGYRTLLDTLMDSNFKDTIAFTGIHPFLFELRNQVASAQIGALDTMATSRNISSTNPYALSETNDGMNPDALPLYNIVTPGTSTSFCSNEASKISFNTRNFVLFFASLPGTYAFDFQQTQGTGGVGGNTNSVKLYHYGEYVSAMNWSATTSTHTWTTTLNSAGFYVLEVWRVRNEDSNANNGGRTCFNFNGNLI